MAKLKQETIMVSVKGGDQLHMKRLYVDQHQHSGLPVFMLPGMAEDGRIFYSSGTSGIANYLALHGYDVFIADHRGKGKSWPSIGERSEFGFHEVVNQDIPALIKALHKKNPHPQQIWVAHGWGGVLLSAYWARYGAVNADVSRMVHFASRRQLTVENWHKRILIDFLWHKVGGQAVGFNGYLPARGLRFGTMNESARSWRDSLNWSENSAWLDTVDEFDYGAAARARHFPPSLYFASALDRAFAHPDDCRKFIQELGPHNGRFVVLSKEGGNLHDYGHVDMLLNPDANQDHFPLVLEWLENIATVWPEQIAV